MLYPQTDIELVSVPQSSRPPEKFAELKCRAEVAAFIDLGKRFHVSERGVTLITPEMLGQPTSRADARIAIAPRPGSSRKSESRELP